MMYMVAIHRPEGYDPAVSEDEAMHREISALNVAMIDAAVRFFAGGLQAPDGAKSLRKAADGKVIVTDGPYLETKEHIGGFWLLETADEDAVLEWAAKAVDACRAPVEVRQVFFKPTSVPK